MSEPNWIGDDKFDIDFVVSLVCDHRNPDTGALMSARSEEMVYQLCHVVPKPTIGVYRIGYAPWRVTAGPWEADHQGALDTYAYKGMTTEEFFDGRRVLQDGLPESRHNVTCDACGTIVPVVGSKMERICNALMAHRVDVLTLHGLKLAAQATS